ncbi:hypothetical protein E4634_20855 [Mangrovimicrobium sediminis]|uniref:Sensor histidine kinase n=1 Tax=Mangrovimicrobium sediminis TaxID=2562682 RepID=A0A4Z0LTP7_9GAMM|nr:hypothetical protein [Haliea sp. SAOS-164]TGD70680.1 hypothetical protein E4634_20855 [Haliea sp. SAOS-164]
MNRWKFAFLASCPILSVLVIVLLYGVIDQAVSIHYMEQGFDDLQRKNEVLGELIVRGGSEYSQEDFLFLLRQVYPEGFIVEDENKLKIGMNVFVFQEGRLSHAE